ncbi:thyrotropin-releasing hormone receptor-like [Ruditapes philippinarum]|uniref:thyrotropin-releasing hormone receptor-like n=1 Tax=Ruditapes philippinarum TaxID=129788 RepID=UPI00295C372B|nr:thyrotropin-releasing hormone receptor-like [Ruditapes philippinarum]
MENRNNSSFSEENSTSSWGSADNDGGLFSITEEAYEEFAFISNIILSPIICAFGIVGNSLGLRVLWKDTRQQKLPIYLFLYSLTCFDLLYLIFGLLRHIPHIIDLIDKQLANYIEEHMKLGTIYVDMVLAHTSHALIVVMSIERLNALMRPFTVKNSWLSRYPKSIIFVCFMFNVIFLIPYPLYFEMGSYQAGNMTEYYIQFKEEAVETMDMYMLVQTIIDYVIPAIVILIINIAIPVVYSRAISERRAIIDMTSQGLNNQQTKITSTVFCITLMYFLLSLPNLFIKVMAFIDKGYSFDGKYKLSFWLFIDISNLFSYINAANDIIIYILVSDHYRRVFIQMYCHSPCCRRWRRHHDLDSGGESKDISLSTISERY